MELTIVGIPDSVNSEVRQPATPQNARFGKLGTPRPTLFYATVGSFLTLSLLQASLRRDLAALGKPQDFADPREYHPPAGEEGAQRRSTLSRTPIRHALRLLAQVPAVNRRAGIVLLQTPVKRRAVVHIPRMAQFV